METLIDRNEEPEKDESYLQADIVPLPDRGSWAMMIAGAGLIVLGLALSPSICLGSLA